MTSMAINVSHIDGSFAATPGETIEEGLLNGMVEAAAFATRVLGSNIAWTEVTASFVKGHVVATGERIFVAPDAISMAAEDELLAWQFANTAFSTK